MILTCPSCGTQYVVKDGAIPQGGRQVRCAACKHSWHQNPDDEQEPAEAAENEPPPAPITEPEDGPAHFEEPAPIADQGPVAEDDAPPEDESIAEATLISPRSGPEAEERAFEESVIAGDATDAGRDVEQDAPRRMRPVSAEDDAVEPVERGMVGTAPRATELLADFDAPPTAAAVPDDEFSPFAERDFVEPRRRSPAATIGILVLLIAIVAAAFWFLAPAEWKARAGLGDEGKTPLELMITHPDRQKLASGQESLTVTGRIINPTGATHTIPPLYAQLKSPSGKIIYSWTMPPPAPSLGPRASTPFNSTQVDVPPGGQDLTITLGSPKG